MENENNHDFFSYEKAIINFVFSFSWNVISTSFDDLAEIMKSSEQEWKCLPLYRRSLNWGTDRIQASYHPTIISDNIKCLHKHHAFDEDFVVLSPYKEDNSIKYKEIDTSVEYDIRLFENGTGTLTFSFYLDKDIKFEKILLIQHLATSIAHNRDDVKDNEEDLLKLQHITHSFIQVPPSLQEKYSIKSDNIYLAEFCSNLLLSISELASLIKYDTNLIGRKPDWQNPYVISILQISDEDLISRLKVQDRLTIKEIGSIAVRLTQDNGESAEEYFKTLKREYIFRSLGFYVNPESNERPKPRLVNYSHSNNLFYTYGRRAAIAMAADFKSHPTYFAIPTFINILEILRSRWHLGTITNLKLDETFEKIAHDNKINKFIDDVFECRILYGLFLQNPSPYLFDSGAVTEISDSAEKIFWLSKIQDELEKKLTAIDKLVEAKFTKQNIENYL